MQGRFLLLVTTCSTGSADLLTHLPKEVVEPAGLMCEHYGWAHGHTWIDGDGDQAKRDLDQAEVDYQNFKKAASGILNSSVVDSYQAMCDMYAWYTANTRGGRSDDAATDMKIYNAHLSTFKTSVKDIMSEELVDRFIHMGNEACWYTANRLKGYASSGDKDVYHDEMSRCEGGVQLVSIDFDTARAVVGDRQPDLVHESVLKNDGNIPQSDTFMFSEQVGHTTNWGVTVGFTVSVGASVEVGFTTPVEGKATFSFQRSFSTSASFSTADTKSTTKTYTFPLTVPPHSVYRATATIQTAKVTMPYKMKLLVGGSPWSITGEWNGVAYSESQYKVEPVRAAVIV